MASLHLAQAEMLSNTHGLRTLDTSSSLSSRASIAVPPSFRLPDSKVQTGSLRSNTPSRPARRSSSSRVNVAVRAQAQEGAVLSREREEVKSASPTKPLKVLVAGAGIGGLVFALGAKNRGIDVEVFERDLTAIRGEGQYRGPIQIQSNALAALEAVDVRLAEAVMAKGCITGDRINGLCDGVTGEWYVKFDTFTPAAEEGLPVTRVISRMTLQELLVDAVGPGIIRNGVTVTTFEDKGDKVLVTLSNGEVVEGDILVGADGIRSRVREVLLGPTMPTYSDYTCYTGICDFVPADIDTVGYRVFLGHRQYFVSSDVGHGKMQWYAFYNEPAGGSDPPNCRKQRLMELFGGWCDAVTDLILATPEEDVLRRDIYDRVPIMQWSKGRVTLLGDSAHAMQPNMGQGGCMAIEDGFQLALDLEKAVARANDQRLPELNVQAVLQQYESERRVRAAAVHGMARMAAIMASTYRAYLGEGLGPLSWLTRLRIPHWGRVAGQVVMKLTMPTMLRWVLGGYRFALEGRAPSCRLEDKAPTDLTKWMEDDDLLERATQAEWLLFPADEKMPSAGMVTDSGRPVFLVGADASKCTVIGSQPASRVAGQSAVVTSQGVEAEHCVIDFTAEHAISATDISSSGTWLVRLNGLRDRLQHGVPTRIHPGETLQFGPNDTVGYRLKLRKPVDEASATQQSGELQSAARA